MKLHRKSLRVAYLVADGLENKQIAALMDITEHGVEHHIRRLVVAWALDQNRNIRVQITKHIAKLAA